MPAPRVEYSVFLSPEYKLICVEYQGKIGRRSLVPYINHINQGIEILWRRGRSDIEMRAFALHPILQDAELFLTAQSRIQQCSPEAVFLAMEYRVIANAGLRKLGQPQVIGKSQLESVNEMLIADKVQNFKDTLLYQQDHPELADLIRYFKQWLTVLGVHEEEYHRLTQGL